MQNPMIICCGEALIDMLPTDLGDGRKAFVPVPGGALFNTAIALGRLGEDTGFLSGISTDMFGAQLIGHLQASMVSVDFCVRSDHPTTLAFVTFDNGDATYSFFDENSAGRNLDLGAIPDLPESELPENVDALHFGGISLIAEPCGTAYEALVARHCQTRVMSFDPNIRPSFVTDEKAYRERLERMLTNSDIIKVSVEDLDWLRPGESFEAAAAVWIKNGTSIVILTRGELGARALTRRYDISVPAPETDVVDTVGAGDAFNAGMLSALRSNGVLGKTGLPQIDQSELYKALEFGVLVAAKTVSRSGANPPWRKEIESGA